jgi:hypothetical protein
MVFSANDIAPFHATCRPGAWRQFVRDFLQMLCLYIENWSSGHVASCFRGPDVANACFVAMFAAARKGSGCTSKRRRLFGRRAGPVCRYNAIVWMEVGATKVSFHSFLCLRMFCAWKSFVAQESLEFHSFAHILCE